MIIVIVAGMHRTGSSALAGMLHNNGVLMGREDDFYPKPMKENPKGFYENVRFRRINDKLLRGYDYKVKRFNPIVPFVERGNGALKLAMGVLINDYKQYSAWGWKDPRTCLTISVWLDMLEYMGLKRYVRILIPCRATADIAKSMKRRGNKGSYRQFEDLTCAYNKRLMMGVDKHKMLFKTVDFNRLLYNTEEVALELTDYLGHPIKDVSFIDPKVSKG